MNDILTNAKKYRDKITREAKAHYLSAEYHRHQDMFLGAIATIVTALVGTGIFAGLVSQLGLEGKSPFSIPSSSLAWLYLIVALLSISAPVLTALHTFLHNAEDAQKHKASEANYNRVVQRLDIYLSRYADLDSAAEKKEEALREFEDILKEYNIVRESSLTMPRKAYEDAEKKLREEAALSHEA